MSPDLIPALDATPIPGPVWLFQGLLVLTFFLHALFLSVALGGSVLAAVAQVGSRGRAGDPRTTLAARIAAMNAYGISFAISKGVAPLLFVQVRDPVERPRMATGVLALTGLTVAAMSVLRHQVRDLYLAPVADRFAPEVAPQWGNFALFAVCLVLALGTVAWMVRRVLTDRATGAEAA